MSWNADAERLLQALPPDKNFDARPKTWLDHQLSRDQKEDEASNVFLPPQFQSQPQTQLTRIASMLSTLSIEEFTLFEQQIGSVVAKKLLLWSLKCLNPPPSTQKSPTPSDQLSNFASVLSEAIMPSGFQTRLQPNGANATHDPQL